MSHPHPELTNPAPLPDRIVFYRIDGTVVAVNQAVIDDPSLVNKDPYGAAWMIKVRPAKATDDRYPCTIGRRAVAWTCHGADHCRDCKLFRKSRKQGGFLQKGRDFRIGFGPVVISQLGRDIDAC